MTLSTLDHYYFAYRKAKYDLYFSSASRQFDLLEYEQTLDIRLSRLHSLVNGTDQEWVRSPDFLGTFTIAPKSWEDNVTPTVAGQQGTITGPPSRFSWSHFSDTAASDGKTATFRVMAHCSIDMHVLSTLWLLTVGAKFDSQLSDSAVGNRLRRDRNGTINLRSSGSFVPYLRPYRQFRKRGLAAIEQALDQGERVIALTGDASAFYHRLAPEFLTDPRYIDLILDSDSLTALEHRLHLLFTSALIGWAAIVERQLKCNHVGLPVGLPASAVVANLALHEFDTLLDRRVVPLHYSRYVDDVFIVLKDVDDFPDPASTLNWLCERSGPETPLSVNDGDLRFAPAYHGGSDIIFANKKNRAFKLCGSSGRAVVSSLSHAILAQGSEWRSLPCLPSIPLAVGTRMVVALQSDGHPADSLSKTEQITARRATFALQLRDFEAYAREVDLPSWSDFRTAFFESVCDHILTPSGFFELYAYLPRLLRLALSTQEFERFLQMIQCIERLVRSLSDTPIALAGYAETPTTAAALLTWRSTLTSIIKTSIAVTLSAVPSGLSEAAIESVLDGIDPDRTDYISLPALVGQYADLFERDLANTPARFAVLPDYLTPQLSVIAESDEASLLESLRQSPSFGVSQCLSSLQILFPEQIEQINRIRPALLFPTRPLSVPELFLAVNPLAEVVPGELLVHISQTIIALRGFDLDADIKPRSTRTADQITLTIPDRQYRVSQRRVALAAVTTLDSQMERAIHRQPDRGLTRHRRLMRLANQIISGTERIDYALFPELSIPPQWFLQIARKLAARGISLIGGVEYVPTTRGLKNEVWMVFRAARGGAHPHVAYRQEKQQPSLGERGLLSTFTNTELIQTVTWKSPPLVRHGDFIFSALICSELLNIDFRARIRGKVDALFVVAWNKDLNTFDALIRSASLDIHAFVVVVNNRRYGDSRVRAPMTAEWKRGLVRHKGGLTDYVIVGELSYGRLRSHQSRHAPEAGEFKPLPHGFVLDDARRRLPQQETDQVAQSTGHDPIDDLEEAYPTLPDDVEEWNAPEFE